MKRFWIGVSLLAIMLSGSIVLTVSTQRIHRPIGHRLQLAADAALEENWVQAETLTQWAKNRWQRFRPLTAAFADHAQIEQIDSGFAQISAFLQQKDANEFSAGCAALARLAQAMADSQALFWWTFL